jgi:hypothetical protein
VRTVGARFGSSTIVLLIAPLMQAHVEGIKVRTYLEDDCDNCIGSALARGGHSTYFTKSKSVHTLKGLALPRACHSGDITLAGSRRLHSTLAAAPVL